MSVSVVFWACVAVVVSGLVVLTGLGERRRGGRWATVVVAGLLFPLTWAAWYARDERPFARPRRVRA